MSYLYINTNNNCKKNGTTMFVQTKKYSKWIPEEGLKE